MKRNEQESLLAYVTRLMGLFDDGMVITGVSLDEIDPFYGIMPCWMRNSITKQFTRHFWN